MSENDRRRYPRIDLRLPVFALRAEKHPWLEGKTTENISGGGMYLRVGSHEAPSVGTRCEFQLLVGPEEGYSAKETRIVGWAEVTRVDPPDSENLSVGIGMFFLQPLAIGL